ncbi:MAG: HD domain-containing protein [Roseiflexaceae bacterium]
MSAPQIRLSEILAALSYALDITEGQPEGHAARSCAIGMRLAQEVGLASDQYHDLFYALLLKDLGCSSNAAKVVQLLGSDDFAAKQDMKVCNWSNFPEAVAFGFRNLAPDRSLLDRARQLVQVGLHGGPFAARDLFQVRCDRGAAIAQMLGFPEGTSAAIRTLDEHWDGHGYPDGLRGDAIPLMGRILCLAQTVDIFAMAYDRETAYRIAHDRSERWFDPRLVQALERFRHDTVFWDGLHDAKIYTTVGHLELDDQVRYADEALLDRIAEAFALVIDAKSSWTFRHSQGVATIADQLARVLGWSDQDLRLLRRAALLHDIGKLGVSNRILDKAGPLTTDERAAMQQHVIYTQQLLSRVPSFCALADSAAAHHERLDGMGYAFGLQGEQITPMMRILAVADICDALMADRPYRAGMPVPKVLDIVQREAGKGLCPIVVEALTACLIEGE